MLERLMSKKSHIDVLKWEREAKNRQDRLIKSLSCRETIPIAFYNHQRPRNIESTASLDSNRSGNSKTSRMRKNRSRNSLEKPILSRNASHKAIDSKISAKNGYLDNLGSVFNLKKQKNQSRTGTLQSLTQQNPELGKTGEHL